jgi:hypothetical protein
MAKEREVKPTRDWIGSFIEVPKQTRIKQTNLITSLFKSWLLFQLRKRPPLRATVLSQRTPIHAGSIGRVVTPGFSKTNQVHTYMHAKIKFHAYSRHK